MLDVRVGEVGTPLMSLGESFNIQSFRWCSISMYIGIFVLHVKGDPRSLDHDRLPEASAFKKQSFYAEGVQSSTPSWRGK